MCRLYAQVSDRETGIHALERGPQPFVALGETEHPDGWGIATYAGSSPHRQPEVERAPGSAARSEQFLAALHSARGDIALVHLRACSAGTVCMADTHPFAWRNWVFAHNGTIEGSERLEAELRPAHLAEIRGGTDSERYAHWLFQQLEGASDQVSTLQRALRTLSRQYRHTSLNAWLSDGRRVYTWSLFDPSTENALRDGGRYYVLRSADFVDDEGAQVTAVSSTAWDGGLNWRDLDNGELLVLTAGQPARSLTIDLASPEPAASSFF